MGWYLCIHLLHSLFGILRVLGLAYKPASVCFLNTSYFISSPAVPDTPASCNVSVVYNQSSGMLLSIDSVWDPVLVSLRNVYTDHIIA